MVINIRISLKVIKAKTKEKKVCMCFQFLRAGSRTVLLIQPVMPCESNTQNRAHSHVQYREIVQFYTIINVKLIMSHLSCNVVSFVR